MNNFHDKIFGKKKQKGQTTKNITPTYRKRVGHL